METKPTLNDAAWDKLVRFASVIFDDLTLKRGFQYYKLGKVLDMETQEDGHLTAQVADGPESGDRYEVTVVPGKLAESACDCSLTGPCKHMAATLMAYAGQEGRPVAQLANARAALGAEPYGRREPGGHTSDAGTAGGANGSRRGAGSGELAGGIGPGRSALPQSRSGGEARPNERLAVLDIAGWHAWFGEALLPLRSHTRNGQYTMLALKAIDQGKPPLAPGEDQMFRLHAQLFILGELTGRGGRPEPAAYVSLGYYTHLAVTELDRDIAEALNEPLGELPKERAQALLRGSLAYLRRCLRESTRELNMHLDYYLALWERWVVPFTGAELAEHPLYKEELAVLHALEADTAKPFAKRVLMLVQCCLYYSAGDDESALERLRAITSGGYMLPVPPDQAAGLFFAPAAAAGQWTRLAAWLAAAGPLLEAGRMKPESYAGYWREAIARIPEAEPLMWDTLRGMLPRGEKLYASTLLAFERYEEWMDLQLASGSRPAEFKVADLQPLERGAPHALLPFYHQAAERFIAEKNRAGYKAAVKLLKRLAKLYKKLKQEPRWESYITGLSARNSRLRAFQEELRKGKLIP